MRAMKVVPIKKGIPFKTWLKEHSENPRASLEGRQLASELLNKGVAQYAEGESEGQTVTRTIEAQEGLLGGPDAYRYDEQGNERGMAQRVDAYSRDKTRQDFQAQRRGDIQDLRELAPQAREAYMAANPEVASRLAQVNRMAEQSETRGPSALASYATGAAPQAAPRSAIGGQALQGTANMMPTETGTGIATRVSEPVSMGDYGKGTMGPRDVDPFTGKVVSPGKAEGLLSTFYGASQSQPRTEAKKRAYENAPSVGAVSLLKDRKKHMAAALKERGMDPGDVRQTVNRVEPLPGQQDTQVQQSATAQGTQYAQDRLGNVSSIQKELETQAQQELAAGSTLTEREKRNLQEASRSAFAGRGLERSNRALLGEMQNRIEGNRQRLAERRAFAAGVSGQGEMMRRGRLQDTMNAGAQQFGQMATAEQLRMAQDSQDQAFALNAL